MKITLRVPRSKRFAELVVDTDSGEITEDISSGYKDPKIEDEFIMDLIEVATDSDQFNGGDGLNILLWAYDCVSQSGCDRFIEILKNKGAL